MTPSDRTASGTTVARASEPGSALSEQAGRTMNSPSRNSCTTDAGSVAAQPDTSPKAFPIDLAPRDGTTVRLLVDYTEATNAANVAKHEAEGYVWPWTPLEDADFAWTIGHNNFDNDGEDVWQFAGWNWSQDHYTCGHGTAVGWLPFHPEQSTLTRAKAESMVDALLKAHVGARTASPARWGFESHLHTFASAREAVLAAISGDAGNTADPDQSASDGSDAAPERTGAVPGGDHD